MKTIGLRAIFSGLSGQVLLWFLVVSILPLLVISTIGYQSAKDGLYQAAITSLRNDVEQQSISLINWYEGHYRNLVFHADNIQNVQLLQLLQTEFKSSNLSLDEFTHSYRWNLITEKWRDDINRFLTTYEYYDIFLIDNEGNILFTQEKESDLGTNLFNGPYSKTGFAKAARKTLKTGRSTFSDLERYSPSDGEAAGFFVSAMLNEEGEKIGLFAFQITPEQIDTALHQQESISVQSYVVGFSDKENNFTLRTPLYDSELNHSDLPKSSTTDSDYLGVSIETDNIEMIASEYEDGSFREQTIKDNSLVYLNHDAISVLGVHHNVSFGSIDWSIVAEIPESTAFASIIKLEKLMVGLVFLLVVLVIVVVIRLTRGFMKPITELATGFSRVSKGELDVQIQSTGKYEISELINGFAQMLAALDASDKSNAKRAWITGGITGLNDTIRGVVDTQRLGSEVCRYLAKYLNVPIMTFYVANNEELELTGSYALSDSKKHVDRIQFGKGIVGQVAIENAPVIVSDIPSDYIKITSSIGNAVPRYIVAVPFSIENKIQGVIEIGAFDTLTEDALELLATLKEPLGLTIRSIYQQTKTKELLEETQRQSEALKAANENLEEQTQRLKQSEEELKHQGEELKVSNEELEEKQTALLEQKEEIEIAKEEVEIKAEELAIASKYKSEFLANMSHELRTPLNSLLLLSGLLSENMTGNLTEDQVQSAKYINEGGHDLLTLINDILDLSKVEAGMLSVTVEDVVLQDIANSMQNLFKLTGQEKGVMFKAEVATNVPASFSSDIQRLQQILKNFLSNAFKFTEIGTVSLNIHMPVHGIHFVNPLLTVDNSIAFSVSDTGIGIPEEKQEAIFEAFQQEDGSTSRKYGGTGLGLSISRELTNLLGGEIQLVSEKDKGSTFTVYLPLMYEEKMEEAVADVVIETSASPIPIPQADIDSANNTGAHSPATNYGETLIPDDRRTIVKGDKSILLIEDDEILARSLVTIIKDNGFKVLVANEGRHGIYLAMEYQPTGILLDIGLPDVDGMEVLEQLKYSLETRHIPIHMLSGEDLALPALNLGALGYLKKPATREQLDEALSKVILLNTKDENKILVVNDNMAAQSAIRNILDSEEVNLSFANDVFSACEMINTQNFDCIILDLDLPSKDGIEIIDELKRNASIELPPIIIYTAQELTDSEYINLKEFGAKIVIKGADSPEHLLSDVSLFLHTAHENLSKQQKQSIKMLHDDSFLFKGRNVLLVDDDMRNIYALSTQLKEQGLNVTMANNGQVALAKMESKETFDLVLMDIMMPIMDGYEAMQAIRESERYSEIPIIALTAKAMPEERNKCLRAGASEFLTKPIDFKKLLSILRVWLYRRE